MNTKQMKALAKSIRIQAGVIFSQRHEDLQKARAAIAEARLRAFQLEGMIEVREKKGLA